MCIIPNLKMEKIDRFSNFPTPLMQAWDVDKKRLCAVGRIDYARGDVQLAESWESLSAGCGYLPVEKVRLMEDTGFRYRNGNPIFEWDIVEYDYADGLPMEHGLVMWCKETGQWVVSVAGTMCELPLCSVIDCPKFNFMGTYYRDFDSLVKKLFPNIQDAVPA